MREGDRVDEILMTPQAVGLKDLGVVGGDADRFGVVVERERLAVVPTVDALGDHLVDEAVGGHVAVVAGRKRMVNVLLPGVIVRLHDMAVDTCRWIFREVTEALSEVEDEEPQTREHAGERGEDESDFSQDPNPRLIMSNAFLTVNGRSGKILAEKIGKWRCAAFRSARSVRGIKRRWGWGEDGCGQFFGITLTHRRHVLLLHNYRDAAGTDRVGAASLLTQERNETGGV